MLFSLSFEMKKHDSDFGATIIFNLSLAISISSPLTITLNRARARINSNRNNDIFHMVSRLSVLNVDCVFVLIKVNRHRDYKCYNVTFTTDLFMYFLSWETFWFVMERDWLILTTTWKVSPSYCLSGRSWCRCNSWNFGSCIRLHPQLFCPNLCLLPGQI